MLSKTKQSKEVLFSYSVENKQWVGDGFYVHPLLRPSQNLIKYINPFILVDYAAAKKFSKSTKRRGVGVHPHRGFETVTLAYQGEIEHRDSAGGGGIIQAGDVQWMTAGKGVVHEEMHSEAFTKEGGVFEMLQLWVNLPSKFKMTDPRYQNIKNESIPRVALSDSSEARIVAGELNGVKGPGSTFTPVNMYDIKSSERDSIRLDLKENTNTVLIIMDGEIEVSGVRYSKNSILVFDQENRDLSFESSGDFKGLVLNGEPIDEPLVASGPFVMNTREEIVEAVSDYQNGIMGQI